MLRLISIIYFFLFSLIVSAQVNFPCNTEGVSNIIKHDSIAIEKNKYYILNKQVKQLGDDTKTLLMLQVFERNTNKNQRNIQIPLPISDIASISNLKVKGNEIMFIMNSYDELYFVKFNISQSSLPTLFKVGIHSDSQNIEIFDYILTENGYTIIPVKYLGSLVLLKYNANGEKVSQDTIFKFPQNIQGINIYAFNSKFLLIESIQNDKNQPMVDLHVFSSDGKNLWENSIYGFFSDLIYDEEKELIILAANQSNNLVPPEIHAIFFNEKLRIENDIILLKGITCDFFSAKLAKFDEENYIYSCVWTDLITVKFNKHNTKKLYKKSLNACIESVVALLATPNNTTYILSLDVFERRTNLTIKDYCIFSERL